MYFMELATAQSILSPRMQTFAMALKSAVDGWNDFGKFHAELDEVARAAIISGLWYNRANQALSSDPGIERKLYGNRPYFRVDGELSLRLKHVGSTYQPWNYRTKRALAWNEQAPFPTILPGPRLDLAYRLDLTGTLILDAIVMLNRERDSIWRWQVWGDPVAEFATPSKDMFGRETYAHADFSRLTP